MRNIALVIICSMFAGCFPSKAWLYRSINEEGRYEERYKGLLNLSYGETLKGNTGFAIAPSVNSEGVLEFQLQISVEKGAQVTLKRWSIMLSSPEFKRDIEVPLGVMSLSVYGRNGKPGHRRYMSPLQVLTGDAVNEELGQPSTDAYMVGVKVNTKPPQRLTVQLPVFVVNGSIVTTEPIEFELIETYNYGYSLQ